MTPFARAAAAALFVLGVSPAFADGPAGQWQRSNGDIVTATVSGGRLYCKITSGSKPGFEMCNGMSESGGSWTGKKMKHPTMSMMSFNGTVTVSGNTLSIKGCAIGQSMCDSEKWKRVN